MNIGFSSFVLQGGRTGVASYILNLLDALQACDQTNHYDLLVDSKDGKLVTTRVPNFRKVEFPVWFGKPIPNIAWHNLALPLRRYDLIHIPSYRRLPLVKGTKIVATVHDLATLHIEGKYDAARMFYNRRVVPSLIRRADHIITVSQFTRNDLINLVGYPGDRITVIYSGINRQSYQPKPIDECRARLAGKYNLCDPFIIFVSRVEHPAKNHVRLIRAFEILKSAGKYPDLKLVLAGADWNGADIVKAEAARSPVAGDILITGFVPLEDVPYFYSACELMAYPSLFEGFGFPIVEAMACGSPVICSNTSSMAEIAADFVPKFDPTNVEEIVVALERGLRSGRTAEWAEKGKAYAATFDWKDTARKVLDVYETVIRV